MTAQEVFETVATHLLKQGGQARNEEGCAYRAPDGSKCAAGCLIPDDLYDPSIEGKAIWALIHHHPEKIGPAILAHPCLVGDLQNLHDSLNYPVHSWGAQLIRIGINFGLNTDFIKEARVHPNIIKP